MSHEDPQGSILKALALAVALAVGAVAAAEFTGFAIFGAADDAEIAENLVAEARCDLTVAQFGPSERWVRHQHVYECATAARELPSYVLTFPLVQQ